MRGADQRDASGKITFDSEAYRAGLQWNAAASELTDAEKSPVMAGHIGIVAPQANTLSIYGLQAKAFTGYWSGQRTLGQPLANTAKGMEELLK